MGSIDDLYFKAQRDYGRKLYRGSDDDDYRTLMKKKTVFMYDEHFKQAWSEFEKPYFADDYDEMETFLWNPPGFTPLDEPDPWDWPTVPSNPQDPGEPFGWPSLTVFWCGVSGCFCENDTREATVNCSHEITGISLAFERLAAKDFSVSAEIMGSSARLSITAGEDPPGALEINVSMKAGNVKGSHDSIMISSCSDCDDCDETSELAWDDELTPSTANDDSRVMLYIKDGVGPFTWTLLNDMNGKAHLSSIQTESRMNRLTISGGACGAASIQVTDSCDNTCEGAVRVIENGSWSRVYVQYGVCSFHRITGLQCKCYCGPCRVVPTTYYSAAHRLNVSCGYVGCNECVSGNSGACILGPCGIADTYNYVYDFPCVPSDCDGLWQTSGWEYMDFEIWRCQ